MHRTHTRWMLQRDINAVRRIDRATSALTGAKPWGQHDFLVPLAQRTCIGMVAEQGDTIVGFMVYELGGTHLTLLRFGVTHGTDAAEHLLAKLLYKVTSHRRERAVWTDGTSIFTMTDAPEWHTSDVRALCGGSEMPHPPILADALQDAGCGNEPMLAALRTPGVGAVVCAGLVERLR